jgi:hypothetical protein
MTVLSIGKYYNFNTMAPSILGASIKNAKLLAILDYSTAITYDNIDLRYRTIYPVLPNGTPDNPELSIYYRFLSEAGEKIILADIWIQESTVEIVEHIRFQVAFTEASLEDIKRVKDAINALGYTNFTITQS